MKTIKLCSAMMLLFTAFAVSCSSDDDKTTIPVAQEENPYKLMMDKASFNSIEPRDGDNVLEAGIFFKPTANGKMTTLIVKLPVADPNLVVNIWDMTNRELIKSEVINIATAATETKLAITPLALDKSIEYAITVRSAKVYVNKRVGAGDPITFPMNCGSIQVTGFGLSQANQFPSPGGTIYYGNVGFKFIRG